MIKAVTGLTTWMKGLNPSTLKTTLGHCHRGDDKALGMLREKMILFLRMSLIGLEYVQKRRKKTQERYQQEIHQECQTIISSEWYDFRQNFPILYSGKNLLL